MVFFVFGVCVLLGRERIIERNLSVIRFHSQLRPKHDLLLFRFERAPVTEREKWWHLMPVKRHHTFR
jgi:hypothetical protein